MFDGLMEIAILAGGILLLLIIIAVANGLFGFTAGTITNF